MTQKYVGAKYLVLRSSLSKGMVRLFVWSQKSWIVAADSHSLSLYNIYTTIHPSTYVYTISDFKSFFWQIRVLSPQRCVCIDLYLG